MRRGLLASVLLGALCATACGGAPLPVPRLTRVVPSQGPDDRAMAITLVGENLLPRASLDLSTGRATVSGTFQAFLGDTALTHVRWAGGLVTAMVPPGLDPGAYTVRLVTPGGHDAALPRGYTVIDALGPEVELTAPTPGGPAAPGQDLAVAVAAGDPSGVAGVTLKACLDAGSGCQPLAPVTWSPAGTPDREAAVDLALPLPASAPEGARVELAVTATDTVGNVGHAAGLAVVRVAPTLTAIDPDAGPEAGLDLVTLTGAGFDARTVFAFGQAGDPATLVAAVSTVVDAHTAVALTPPGTGTVDVVASRGEARAVLSGAYTYHPVPVITAVDPPSVSIDGGTIVALEGTDLAPGPVVTVDGVAVPVTFTSATRVDVRVPAHGAGDAPVVLTDHFGTATTTLRYNPAPILSTVNPAGAPEAGGTLVEVRGSRFVSDPAARMLVGGQPVGGVVMTSSGDLTFRAPPGTGTVKLQLVGQRFPPSNTLDFTYYPPPTVAAVSPDNGPRSGGGTVTVTGTGFVPGGTTKVLFGRVEAAGVVRVDDHTLTATVPPGAASGPVDVTVTDLAGKAVASGAYTYNCTPAITGVQPQSGPAGATTRVVLTGRCFAADPGLEVDFGTVAGTGATVVSPTELDVTAPAEAAGKVPVSVTLPRRDPSSPNGAFTYVAGAPSVHLLAPAPGRTVAPGQPLVVTVAATGGTAGVTTLRARLQVGGGIPVTASAPVTQAASVAHVFTLAVPTGAADGTPVGVGASATTAAGDTVAAPDVHLTVQAVPSVLALTVTPSPLALSQNERRTLAVVATRSDGRQVDLAAAGATFTVLDPTVATVDGSGEVTGVAPGRTTVTATDPASGRSAQVPVTVTDARGRVFPPRLLLPAGQSVPLTVSRIAGTSAQDVTATTTWHSSDPSVATVDAGGKVTAVGAGTATVTGTYQSAFTVTVPVEVAGAKDPVTLAAGAPWFLPAGDVSFGGLSVPAGASLVGYGPACLHLSLGTGGLAIDAGGQLDVSGAAGGRGAATGTASRHAGQGGHGGPGAGGGGAGGGATGAGAPAPGKGSPPGAAASGHDGGAGGGPGAGGGGVFGQAGPAGGGGASGGDAGRGGDGQASTYAGSAGTANGGTAAGGGSGGGGGGYAQTDGWASGGGGGGGCLRVDVLGGRLTVAGTLRADGGEGGAGVQLGAPAGGGGGGSGGTITLSDPGGSVTVPGRITAEGGTGGGDGPGGGGGGGGGGRVSLSGGTYALDGARIDVEAGLGGVPSTGPATPGEAGAPGQVAVGP